MSEERTGKLIGTFWLVAIAGVAAVAGTGAFLPEPVVPFAILFVGTVACLLLALVFELTR